MAKGKVIFLVGMPAAGKTFWGGKLAAAYGLHFIDLDALICEREGSSVAELFAGKGESVFREKERFYLFDVIKNLEGDTIIACGGGTPCYFDNIKLMKDAGCVVYLQAPVSALLRNLADDGEIRPLLLGKDPARYLTGLLRDREKFYTQAHHILQTREITIDTFAQIISQCTNRL